MAHNEPKPAWPLTRRAQRKREEELRMMLPGVLKPVPADFKVGIDTCEASYASVHRDIVRVARWYAARRDIAPHDMNPVFVVHKDVVVPNFAFSPARGRILMQQEQQRKIMIAAHAQDRILGRIGNPPADEWNEQRALLRGRQRDAREARDAHTRAVLSSKGIRPEYTPLVERIVNTVMPEGANNYRTHSQVDHAERVAYAHRAGLTPIGNTSYHALMVAAVPDAPDVVVKVCRPGDKFIEYATACYDGEFGDNPHFLKVHAAVPLDKGCVLFVIERLARDVDFNKWRARVSMWADHVGHSYYKWLPEVVAEFCGPQVKHSIQCATDMLKSWCDTHNISTDLHGQNVMYRADGTLVLLDPVC